MSNRIRRRGKASWEIQLELARDASGKRVRRFYSCKGTRKDAEKKLVALLASIDKGDYVDKSKRTIAQHIAERIEVWSTAKTISPKTKERYLELARNQINPHLGPLELQRLKSHHIEDWHNTLRTSGRKDGKGGVSSLTIRHAHRLLAKGLRDAARHNLVSQNAASVQGAPSVDRVEMGILTADQIASLPKLLDGHKLYPRAVVALFAGLRRGELLGLRWHRIDLEAGSLKVETSVEVTKAGLREKAPKTAAGRRELMLPTDLVEVLREHYRTQLAWSLKLGLGRPAGNALVFPRDDDPTAVDSPRALSAAWKAFADKHGMKGVRFHDLRHTHASILIDQKIDIAMISKRLGHSTPGITLSIYSHQFAQTDDRAAAALDGFMARLKDKSK